MALLAGKPSVAYALPIRSTDPFAITSTSNFALASIETIITLTTLLTNKARLVLVARVEQAVPIQWAV